MQYLLTLLLLTWAAWGQCANSNSVDFDAVGDTVAFTSPPANAGEFTFFFHTKSDADPAGFHYYLYSNAGFNRVLIYNSSGNLGYRFGNSALTSIGAGPTDSISATGEWETLIIRSRRAGTDSVAFLHLSNGVLTQIFFGPLSGAIWTNTPTTLGGQTANSVVHKMDNFAYFTREIPNDTLVLMEEADLTDYGPAIYFKFDGDYTDSGSLGNDGTNGGTTLVTDVPFTSYSNCTVASDDVDNRFERFPKFSRFKRH